MLEFIRTLSCLFLFVFIISSPHEAAAQERILSMDVVATVRADGTALFRETLWIRVENVKIKRGIVRVFPTNYKNTEGKWIVTGFKLLSASIHRKPTEVKIEREGRNLEIRIGDPDKTLSRGDHVFEIEYETAGWIAFRDKFDELYWNVTGNDWDFPIDKASFRLVLPDGAYVSKRVAFTGRRGARGENYAVKPDGRVVTKTPLVPGEGLTVASAWPKGFVTPPPPSLEERIERHRAPLTAALVVVVFLYHFLAWFFKGRDPAKGVVIPLFRPPGGVEPGFARYLRKMRYSKEILVADILQLAAMGFLRFIEEGGVTRILPTAKAAAKNELAALPESLAGLARILRLSDDDDIKVSGALRLLLNGSLRLARAMGATDIDVKATKSPVDGSVNVRMEANRPGFSSEASPESDRNRRGIAVTDENGHIFYEAGRWLEGRYKRRAKKYFLANRGWSILGAFLLLPLFCLTFRPIPSEPFLKDIFGLAFGIALIVLFLVGRAVHTPLIFAVFGAFFLFILGVVFGVDTIGAVGFTVALLIVSFFSRIMPVYTQEGRKTVTAIEGLVMYMRAAERDRLALLNPPDRTPEHFEALLPYAFALGCAKTWADSFASVLASASYNPAWQENGGMSYSPRFTDSLSKGINSSVSHYQSKQSSSSSSSYSGGSGFSGGSSGGGGGGGGGRGW